MKTTALLCLLLSATFAAAGAEVYRWTDEQGRTHYGDSVPDRYRNGAQRVLRAEAGDREDPQLRAYLDSDACFARYRNANRSIKAEAFRHCKDVPAPRDVGETR
jgi:hypothetical protein